MGKKDLTPAAGQEVKPATGDKFNKKNTGQKNSGRLSWKIICYSFIILFLILTFIAFSYLLNFYPGLSNKVSQLSLNILKTTGENKNKQTCPDCVRRFIDGSLVSPGQENFYPLAVVIDNHPDSRPVFGLSRANLVYEAEAEGGITRYLAIFANGEEIEKIGPVRSARPYFVDWVKELSALFVHCGGSPEALVKIYKESIFNLNEFYQGSYFWRAGFAPHNIFISSADLSKYLENKNLTEGKFLKWQFKDETPAPSDQNKIEIGFKYPDFVVQWEYDKINNEYIRYLGGEIHQDEENGQEIRAKNVIIQYLEAKIIDEELRLKMNTLGKGRAILCLDGQCLKGEWRKNNSSSRTRYYYNNNEEVKFNAGKIWVEIVKPELQIIY